MEPRAAQPRMRAEGGVPDTEPETWRRSSEPRPLRALPRRLAPPTRDLPTLGLALVRHVWLFQRRRYEKGGSAAPAGGRAQPREGKREARGEGKAVGAEPLAPAPGGHHPGVGRLWRSRRGLWRSRRAVGAVAWGPSVPPFRPGLSTARVPALLPPSLGGESSAGLARASPLRCPPLQPPLVLGAGRL
jgi:hypothetical protein